MPYKPMREYMEKQEKDMRESLPFDKEWHQEHADYLKKHFSIVEELIAHAKDRLFSKRCLTGSKEYDRSVEFKWGNRIIPKGEDTVISFRISVATHETK